MFTLILLLGLLWSLREVDSVNNPQAARPVRSEDADSRGALSPGRRPPHVRPAGEQVVRAEEVVARKLAAFSRSRRELAHALARRRNVPVPDEVEAFFAAVERGNWTDIETAFKKISGGDSSAGHGDSRPPGVQPLWPAIVDAYGAAEQVHLWPAQELLNYGNAILDALKPGMVYVGGTDNGRWIPELLNETGSGEPHIVLTQNALADASYLDYVCLQYEGRLANLGPEESQRAFQEYIADAARRAEHDQQYPDEPRQVRPGEEIVKDQGKVQVSGQVAVMAINEKLLEMLMQKNPEISFALQESFPLRGTYADALPLGPIMELNSRDEQNSLSPKSAAQTSDYWQSTAQRVLSDPEAAGSEAALKSYSHDAVAAANLLAAHGMFDAAERTYRNGQQLWPDNPESVGGLADVLVATGREEEARRVLVDYAQKHPEQRKDLERVSSAMRLIWNAYSKPSKPPM